MLIVLLFWIFVWKTGLYGLIIYIMKNWCLYMFIQLIYPYAVCDVSSEWTDWMNITPYSLKLQKNNKKSSYIKRLQEKLPTTKGSSMISSDLEAPKNRNRLSTSAGLPEKSFRVWGSSYICHIHNEDFLGDHIGITIYFHYRMIVDGE